MQGGFGKAVLHTRHHPRQPSAAARPPFSKVTTSLTATSSGDLEVTVDFLTEVDKLVQLIECPIFTCKEETPGGEGAVLPLPAPPSRAAAAARINRAEVMRLLAGRFAQHWSCPPGKGHAGSTGGQPCPPDIG